MRAALAGVLLFVIGLAIGGGAVMNFRRERDQLAGWTRTTGHVVQLLQSSRGAGRPVVGFTAANGDPIHFTDAGPLASRSYHVGDSVSVIYPVLDPSMARIDSPVLRWGRPLYAAVGAIVLMALGGYLAWYARGKELDPGPRKDTD